MLYSLFNIISVLESRRPLLLPRFQHWHTPTEIAFLNHSPKRFSSHFVFPNKPTRPMTPITLHNITNHTLTVQNKYPCASNSIAPIQNVRKQRYPTLASVHSVFLVARALKDASAVTVFFRKSRAAFNTACLRQAACAGVFYNTFASRMPANKCFQGQPSTFYRTEWARFAERWSTSFRMREVRSNSCCPRHALRQPSSKGREMLVSLLVSWCGNRVDGLADQGVDVRFRVRGFFCRGKKKHGMFFFSKK